MDDPTFTPSVHVKASGRFPNCHFFVQNGAFAYCGDSEHGLVNQTVAMVEWPEWSAPDHEAVPAERHPVTSGMAAAPVVRSG